jgi:hypothetical protein
LEGFAEHLPWKRIPDSIAKTSREADHGGKEPITNSSQMLTYYESHLVFTTQGAADESLNGDDGNDVIMKSS